MKALVIDSGTSEVCGWFEFENNFGFGDFCGLMARSIGHEPAGDFAAAMAEVTERYNTDDLLKGDQMSTGLGTHRNAGPD